MIEGARQLLAQVLTVDAVNVKIAGLNTRLRTSGGWLDEVPLLPTDSDPAINGVQDLWHRSFREITRPGVGYMIGVMGQGAVGLLASGMNRMTLPLHIECVSEVTDDQEKAIQQVSTIYAAVLRVLEDMEGTMLTGVTPPIAGVLVGSGSFEVFTLDAAASGKILLVRARHDLTVDDARN